MLNMIILKLRKLNNYTFNWENLVLKIIKPIKIYYNLLHAILICYYYFSHFKWIQKGNIINNNKYTAITTLELFYIEDI